VEKLAREVRQIKENISNLPVFSLHGDASDRHSTVVWRNISSKAGLLCICKNTVALQLAF